MFKALIAIGAVIVALGIFAAGGGVWLFYHYGHDLPDYQQLADYQPPMVTRMHAGDGRLLAEFAKEKRVFVPIGAMPKLVIKAFLSAEDKTFYDHPGIDIPGIIRAMLTNLSRIGSNRRPIGASTITQQVAKNFLLTNEVSIARKAKEAILAFRIEHAFGKDRILELYLNEIYLGMGSYGVAAAALNYFNTSLNDLTLAQAAFLAGLPKAPNNYHPIRKAKAALARRNYVLTRMATDGYISQENAAAAKRVPLDIQPPDAIEIARAEYFVEEVRRQLVKQYGADKLYGGGLSVRTSLDPRLQTAADTVLREGLIAYDRRHGWRGPLGRIDSTIPVEAQFEKLGKVAKPDGWRRAVVTAIDSKQAHIRVIAQDNDNANGIIPFSELVWARAWVKKQLRGPLIHKPADVLAVGDVILVEPVSKNAKGEDLPPGSFGLRQIPDVSGALVALDPHTGRVLAMSGGFLYDESQFNRATQARRQPGSAFKPLVYLAALDRGFTPSSLILDAPFVVDQGPGLGKWKPRNYGKKFYGPSPMRLGIEKSRNLMTIRLAQYIGMETVADYAQRFGVVDRMPRMLSMALGAGETTLIKLTTAYAMLVNGGKRITPSFIDRIQDRNGKTVFKHDSRPCKDCLQPKWDNTPPPAIPDTREQVADPRSAYQVVSMLQGVVERGTGQRIRAVGKPLAGKTGTTNDSLDTWFVGFAPDLAVGVFIGFDKPHSLGLRETGSSVAAPVFRDFMAQALAHAPAIPFRIPPGIRLVRVSSRTGLLARPGERGVILEAFKPGTEPSSRRNILDGTPRGSAQETPPGRKRDLY